MKIGGAVQGVGFRPFAYRIATELGLSGWILNNAEGVICEVEAETDMLEQFEETLRSAAPPLAHIDNITRTVVKTTGRRALLFGAAKPPMGRFRR